MEYVVSIETAVGITAAKAVGKVNRIVIEGSKLIVDFLFYYDASAMSGKKTPLTLKTHEFDLEPGDLDAIKAIVKKYTDPLDSVYDGPPKVGGGAP